MNRKKGCLEIFRSACCGCEGPGGDPWELRIFLTQQQTRLKNRIQRLWRVTNIQVDVRDVFGLWKADSAWACVRENYLNTPGRV